MLANLTDVIKVFQNVQKINISFIENVTIKIFKHMYFKVRLYILHSEKICKIFTCFDAFCEQFFNTNNICIHRVKSLILDLELI